MQKMVLLTIFVFYSIILRADPKKTKVILSTSSKKKLLKTQANVIDSVKKYLPEIDKNQRRSVEKFLNACEKDHFKAIDNVTKYLSNPLNGYTLIKRLSADLSYVEKALKKTTYARTAKMLYPKPTDLETAKHSLTILIKTYHLNVTQLADGILESNFSNSGQIFTEVVTPMTSSDCYELAKSAFGYGELDTSLKWAEESLRKYEEDCQNDCLFTRNDILQVTYRVCRQKGNPNMTRYWWHKIRNYTKNNNNTTEYEILKTHFKRIYDEQSQNVMTLKTSSYVQDGNGFSEDDTGSYGNFSLCSGGHINQKRLFCQYRYGPHPFLRLARFKTELLHQEPDVIMFHDVISDNEIKIVKKLSVPKFTDAGTYLVRRQAEQLTVRVGQTAFLSDDVSKTVAGITQRAMDINDQAPECTDKEGLQVAYYGPGGFYVPHFDTFLDSSEEYAQNSRSGVRRFTTLFYLSEGNHGGATIFCELGLTVFPRENSAIFWRNILSDGRADERFLHAGCPVLYGSKWVATKWLSDPDKKVCYANSRKKKLE